MQYDRLDVTNVASLQLASWRLVMIERAAKLNPKAPVIAGLHRMIGHALSEGDGVTTKGFTAHMAEIAEKEARILKPNRPLREEIGHRSKPDGSGNDKQDRKLELAKCHPRHDAVRSGCRRCPPSADTSWRGFSLLKGSATFRSTRRSGRLTSCRCSGWQ